MASCASWRGVLLLGLVLHPGAGARAADGGGVAEVPWLADAAAQGGQWRPSDAGRGRVRAWREVALSAPFDDAVEEVSAVPGQRVSAGEPLARLAPGPLAALLGALQESEGRVRIATERLSDEKRLLADRIATRGDVLRAEAELSRARQERDSAWSEVEDALRALGREASRDALVARLSSQEAERVAGELAEVRAPLDAVVAERGIAAEARVERGGLLFRLEDMSRIVIEVPVTKLQADEWLRGRAFLDAGPGAPVEMTSPVGGPLLDPGTGLLTLRYEAPGRDGGPLDGEWVPVHMEGEERSVVWVPAVALVGRDGKTWCVRRRGKGFETVEVTAGPEREGRVPVLSGLSAGDRVVTDGAYLLLYRDLDRLVRFED